MTPAPVLPPPAGAALARSEALLGERWRPAARSATLPQRWFALGDPQTSRERLFSFLHDADVLSDDGALRPDVGLVCVGDYFDYSGTPGEVAREGLGMLRWLSAHPADQVVLLLGNHDTSRLMEFATLDDAAFAAAQDLARRIGDATGEERARLEEQFRLQFPTVPTPDIVLRDFRGFSVAQRELLKQLLVARRAQLGVAATLPDATPTLITHAGVTVRELKLLGAAPDEAPVQLAGRLQHLMDRAVRDREAGWIAGRLESLDLGPIHLAGRCGEEGGGLLYHRPAHPRESRSDLRWAFQEGAYRRFDPSVALPEGLVQVCGHTGHSKCLAELGHWAAGATPPSQGGLRTLRVEGGEVHYEIGIQPPAVRGATMYLIDGELVRVDRVEHGLLLFPLGSVVVPRQSLTARPEAVD